MVDGELSRGSTAFQGDPVAAEAHAVPARRTRGKKPSQLADFGRIVAPVHVQPAKAPRGLLSYPYRAPQRESAETGQQVSIGGGITLQRRVPIATFIHRDSI